MAGKGIVGRGTAVGVEGVETRWGEQGAGRMAMHSTPTPTPRNPLHLRKKRMKHQRKPNNTSLPTQCLAAHLPPDFTLSLNAGSGGTSRETFIFPIALSGLNDKPTSASWICCHCYVVNAVDTIVVAGEVVVDHEEQAESPG
ncbi:hypothetical protein BDQ17DRAFT_1339690 [Cyathus striatus]|nr:hypothetical protein BDQ17DRAFT_1339690 [Cyathus striatus]